MASKTKKATTVASKVSTETGATEYYVIVQPEDKTGYHDSFCSKILTGKVAASREGQAWLKENYDGQRIFVAQIVGEMKKKVVDGVNKIPVIEV